MGKRTFHRKAGGQAVPAYVKREIERASNQTPRRPKPEMVGDIRQVFSTARRRP